MIAIWCLVSLVQTALVVSYSIYRQRRKITFTEFFPLIISAFLLFIFSPIAGVIASFLVVDKMRARQIERKDLSCTEEAKAIRSMLKASKIRMSVKQN